MAKQTYDVTKRFQEVRKRAAEINTAPSRSTRLADSVAKTQQNRTASKEQEAYDTRPGRPKPGQKTGDVNLPLSTAPWEVRKKYPKQADYSQRNIDTAPTKKRIIDRSDDVGPAFAAFDEGYKTRPGRTKGPNSGKDVNLPDETPRYSKEESNRMLSQSKSEDAKAQKYGIETAPSSMKKKKK